MKSVRTVLLMLFVFSCALAAVANSAPDPVIKVKDPLCTSRCGDIQSTKFQFSTPASGSGTLAFTNASGVDWTSLRLVESGVLADSITCITDIFATCKISDVNGHTVILLRTGGNFTGILNHSVFTITFGCQQGCWPGNLPFTATANVPEPGTIALVLTGLGGIVTRRKWLQRA